MVSSHIRVESASPLASPTVSSASSSGTTNSFAQQLATALEGYLNQSKSGSQLDIKVSEVAGQNSGASQFLVTVTPGASAAVTTGLGATGGPTSGSIVPSVRPPSPAPATPPAIPTMLGMGPVPGTAPVIHVGTVTAPQPLNGVPLSEGDAYWGSQPAAVQALRNMPDGDAKNRLALNLANQGYSIDTQIMVWGWDPQMTMTVRENQGYAWVPSYGQSNIAVGPGLSMPENPNSYNPASPQPGSIQVSTAFAVGTIQNPLVQLDPTAT
jgi:hypothetical protein